MRDKHQNADSLIKKTEFYERLEQKQANQAEILVLRQSDLQSTSHDEMAGQVRAFYTRTS